MTESGNDCVNFVRDVQRRFDRQHFDCLIVRVIFYHGIQTHICTSAHAMANDDDYNWVGGKKDFGQGRDKLRERH